MIGAAIAASALIASGCVRLKVEVPSELVEVETDAQQVRRAMSEMRGLGTALEGRAAIEGAYPVAGGGVDVGRYSLAPFERLEPDLAELAFPVPAVDPWGHSYLYWSDGRRYAIVCTGSDGVIGDLDRLVEILDAALQGPPKFLRPQYTKCLEEEIVLIQGSFVLRSGQRVRPCK